MLTRVGGLSGHEPHGYDFCRIDPRTPRRGSEPRARGSEPYITFSRTNKSLMRGSEVIFVECRATEPSHPLLMKLNNISIHIVKLRQWI